MTNLIGRHVAITGAGRGIGAATARLLLDRGARVALGDLEAPAIDHPNASAHVLDVTDEESFARFLAAAGPVDALVNNAGIMPVGGFLAEPSAVSRRQVDVNVHGVLNGMRLALPEMIRRGGGHVVNLGSAASRVGLPGEAVYCGTKHFVLGVSEAVRAELLGTGVEVSVVLPNLAATTLGSGMAPARGSRLLRPEEVAAAIVDVLERPRFEVSVPAALSLQLRLRALLPVRARDGLMKAMRMDRVATEVREQERVAYARELERAAGDVA